MITLIVATTSDNGIGKGGTMLWNIRDLQNDMNHFLDKTFGKIVIMGRKTFESIGKPLAGRTNIVLSRDKEFNANDCFIYDSFEQLEQELRENLDPKEEVFVIGGEEMYKLFLPIAERIYQTIVYGEFEEPDTYFPPFSKSTEWVVISSDKYLIDDNNKYEHLINLYERQ